MSQCLSSYFSESEILLAPRPDGAVFGQFVSRTVDAIAGAQRRCQNQPCHKRGPAAELQILRQNIGSVRPQVRAEEFAYLSFASARVKYSISSCLVLRQAKYVYDCVNPSFARRYITLGA